MKDREYRDWVASLAPGDEVTIRQDRSWLGEARFLEATVVRLTARQVVVRVLDRERRYWRDHERRVGRPAGGPDGYRLHRLTDEDRAEIELWRLRRRFEEIAHAYRRRRERWSAERLAAVLAAYDAHGPIEADGWPDDDMIDPRALERDNLDE